MSEKEKKTTNINWFPGHMKKAYVKIEEYLKMIDFVIIVLDARAPFSSAMHVLHFLVLMII